MNDLKIILIISVVLVSGLFVNQAFGSTDQFWSFREQDASSGGIEECLIRESITNPRVNMSSFLLDDKLDIDAGIVVGDIQQCLVFKSFDKADIIGKQLNVTLAGSSQGFTAIRVLVFDGEYIRSNNTDFGDTFGGASPFGFNDAKGGYVLHEIIAPSTTFTITTETLNMTLVGSVLPQVTVAVTVIDTSSSQLRTFDLFNVTIANFGIWNFDENTFFKHEFIDAGTGGAYGLFNTTFNNIGDLIPPVISAKGSEPIQLFIGSAFNIFTNVQCIDDVDGTIPNGANFAVVGGQTVDIDVLGSQSQSYTCTDQSTNNSIEVIDYFVNRQSTGSGSSFEREVDLPPAFEPERIPVDDVDRAFSLFDQLNSLFTPTEPVIDLAPSQPPIFDTTPIPEPESFVDRIRNFFSGLFG